MIIRNCSQINKTSRLPNGVSRVEERDKRHKNPKTKICFNALVYVNGEKRIKHFRVSENTTEQRAKEVAIAFREYYELCEKRNIQMNYNAFDGWNSK